MQEAVRKSAAAQLHQLAMITPPDGGSHHLVKPLLTLLNDSSPAVLLSVLSHMPIVMSRLCLDANNYRDIVSALVATEEASARQWRLAVAIVAAIQEMVDEVPFGACIVPLQILCQTHIPSNCTLQPQTNMCK